jgi:hypothetical protein
MTYDNEQLQKAYPTRTRSVIAFTLNTRLRLIPELTNLSTRSKIKVGRLRARELDRFVTTWELQQLDWRDKANKMESNLGYKKDESMWNIKRSLAGKMKTLSVCTA